MLPSRGRRCNPCQGHQKRTKIKERPMAGFCLLEKVAMAAARNKNFGLSSLASRRKRNDLLFFHKLIHNDNFKLESFVSLRASVTRGGTIKYNVDVIFFTHRTVPLVEKLSKMQPMSIRYNVLKKTLDKCQSSLGLA
ncbi:hypothetical protein OSTOST_21010, partial [Ostertagia ostertagi]